jgi:hypothetical protein
VEYYSQTAGGWIPAVIQRFDAQRGTYCLDVQPMAFPHKVRAATKAASSSNEPTAQASQDLEGMAAGPSERSPVEATRQPSSSEGDKENARSTVASEYANAGSTSGNGRFPAGTEVEYYSNTHGKWVPANVQDFNDITGAYKLDIQPVALPGKVRRVQVTSEVQVSAASAPARLPKKSIRCEQSVRC